MKNAKKQYIPAEAILLSVNKNDIIRTSGFDGPGDIIFPIVDPTEEEE